MDGNQLMWEARWAAAGYLMNIAKHGYTSREYNELYLHFKPAQTAVLVDVDVLKPDTTYYKKQDTAHLLRFKLWSGWTKQNTIYVFKANLRSVHLLADHSWRVCRYKEGNLRVHSLWNSSVWRYIKESQRGCSPDTEVTLNFGQPSTLCSNVGHPTHKDGIYQLAHPHPENEWP